MNVLQKTSRLKDKKGIDWCINYFNEYSFREMRSSARSFTCSLLQISQMLVKKVFATLCFSHADHALILCFSYSQHALICISHSITTTIYTIVDQQQRPRSMYYVVFHSRLSCMFFCFSHVLVLVITIALCI